MDAKSPKSAPKTQKTAPKTRKKSKKPKIRASPSYHSGPKQRKNRPDATAKADGLPKIPQKYPQKLAPKSYPQSPAFISSSPGMALTPPAPSATLPGCSTQTMRFPRGRRPIRLGGWEWGPGEAAARVQASETPSSINSRVLPLAGSTRTHEAVAWCAAKAQARPAARAKR